MSNLYQTLAKPFVGLAPMDGVTNAPFRLINKKYGGADIVYTEFSSVEGICRGASQLLNEFFYLPAEKPIIAQIFGKTAKFFYQTTILLCELGFDGIDINMGCPAKNVSHHGSGAALINQPKLAQQIIKACKQAINDFLNGYTAQKCPDLKPKVLNKLTQLKKLIWDTKNTTKYQINQPIPVSVKTRIGFDKPIIETWIPILLEAQPDAITIHGRTVTQGYSGKADWSAINQAAKIIHQTKTLIIGNGDVQNRTEAKQKAKQYDVDGILIGRASFGNPFVFSSQSCLSNTNINIFNIALEHTQLYEKIYPKLLEEKYHFFPMRKYLGWYTKNLPAAKKLRQQLFLANSSQAVKKIFNKWSI